MHLGTIDYAIVAAYFALIIGMGLYFGRKAKRSMLDYFLSHRSMPWWLAGTAMVATDHPQMTQMERRQKPFFASSVSQGTRSPASLSS
jgi:hypothetical protein